MRVKVQVSPLSYISRTRTSRVTNDRIYWASYTMCIQEVVSIVDVKVQTEKRQKVRGKVKLPLQKTIQSNCTINLTIVISL